ncbi:NUDIX domain-containing protein [Patescibacteria group bacterium]
MSKDELLDLVNDKDEVIGEVWKSEAHKSPSIIHREVAITVFNSRGKVLIQQRCMEKATDPGIWVTTAAGHIGVRENPRRAVKRELFEELGFDVSPKYYKKIFHKRKNKESRFFWIYYAIVKELPEININKEEVMATKWINPLKLVDFAKKNNWDINGLSHKYVMEVYKKLFGTS